MYVLDEPTANLDARAIRVLHDQIAAILARGKTVIVAEHRLYFVADLIDRAVLIEGGRVAREFSPEDLRALSEEERARLGLRAVDPAVAMAVTCPAAPACATGALERGLSLRGFASLRKKRWRASSARRRGSCASTAHRSMPARAAAGARSSCRT